MTAQRHDWSQENTATLVAEIERLQATVDCLHRQRAEQPKPTTGIERKNPDPSQHSAASDDRMMQRIHEQRSAMENMRAQIGALRGALLAISEWRMPYPGFSWQNGSNGERDHFRAVANQALAWKAE